MTLLQRGSPKNKQLVPGIAVPEIVEQSGSESENVFGERKIITNANDKTQKTLKHFPAFFTKFLIFSGFL